MPYSFSTFDDYIFTLINDYRPSTVLDVGPGIGKIGSMVAKSCRTHNYPCILHAYEIYEPYIKQYELKWIYDKIWNEDIMNIISRDNASYDMIFFGDSLEHLTKKDGLKLIEFMLLRCEYIIIKTPDNMPQGAVGGNEYEAHQSNWNRNDFNDVFDYRTEEHFNKQNAGQVDTMKLFVLRGTG
jgi:hypothetical protein